MGYTGYTVEQIERAIVDALKADQTLARYVKTFDRLPWERGEEIAELVKRYPALLVAYMGGNDDSGIFSVADHTGRFAVCCCARNLRSPTSPLGESTIGEKGVYDMLLDVLNCLHFATLGLSILSCRSLRVEPLAASGGIVIFSREIEVKWRMSYSAV